MKRNTILIFSIAALTLSACGDDDRPADTNDGGSDSSTPDSTINTPDGSNNQPDGSTVDNRTRQCGMWGGSLREIWDEPRCAEETTTCIEACDGETQQEILECANACVAADETAPRMNSGLTINCEFCLSYELFTCMYKNGCDTAIADFNCCVTDKCSGLTGQEAQTCAQAMCATQGQAQNTCFASKQTECAGASQTCFPGGAAGDAGTQDAAVDAGADAGA